MLLVRRVPICTFVLQSELFESTRKQVGKISQPTTVHKYEELLVFEEALVGLRDKTLNRDRR